MRDSSFYELDMGLDINWGCEEIQNEVVYDIELRKSHLKETLKKLRNLFVVNGLANLNNDEKTIYLTNKALEMKINGKTIDCELNFPSEIIVDEKSSYSNFISGMCYKNKTHTTNPKNVRRVDFVVKLNDVFFVVIVEYSCEGESIIFETKRNEVEYYLTTDSNSFFVPKCITLCLNKDIFETVNLVLPKPDKLNEEKILNLFLEKDCIVGLVKSEEKKFLREKEAVLSEYVKVCEKMNMNNFTSVEKILLNDELNERFPITRNTYIKVSVFTQKQSFQKYISTYLTSGLVNKKIIRLTLVSSNVEKVMNEFSFVCLDEIFDIENFVENSKIY